MERRYFIRTLGCKANVYDSQQIETELRKLGWTAVRDELQADLCIINTCTVTDEADREGRRIAARLGKVNPEARIVITGCSAEVAPERMAEVKNVHYVVSNRDKKRLVELVLQAAEETARHRAGVLLGNARGYEAMTSRHSDDREWPDLAVERLPDGDHHRTRAFLKVQEGCNAFCTYCIIPYGRGPSRSLSVREVLERVRRLVDSGVREIVVTGTNIGHFGKNPPESLLELIQEILDKTSLERLRLSSLHPKEITPGLTELVARSGRLCPHFHVSLQSPHTRVLRGMKRTYTTEDVAECLERIARIPVQPGGVFVGMDVIAGFPGETEMEFGESLKTLESLPWTQLHVFPYSEREGTPATRMSGKVSQEEKTRRAKLLRDLGFQRLTEVHERALKDSRQLTQPVGQILIEGDTRAPDGSTGWVGGYTPNYFRILVPASDRFKPNTLISAHPRAIMTCERSNDAVLIADVSSD